MNPMQLLTSVALLRWPAGLAVLGTILLSACGTESGASKPTAPKAAVTVAAVETGNAVQYGEYAARVRSSGAVELRAQVGGVLQDRLYREGEFVQQGEALFQIDPEPYTLALRRAKAELAEAKAEHGNAKREWRRQQDLFARKVSSEHDKDKAETALQAASARLQKAQAAENDARRMLRYARVEAPVAGIVGLEALAEGNLVESGTLLTTITPLDPIHVHFTLPARDAALRQASTVDGTDSPVTIPVTTGLLLDQGRTFAHEGQLNFTDARIDPRTDSIQMRAVFPNPDGELLPGQFVRLKLPLQQYRDVVLIDPKAVTEGPQGPQVFTVEDGAATGEQTARSRPVTLGPVLNGRQVVLAGLSPGDQLVVNGQVALRPGRAVTVTNTASAPAATHAEVSAQSNAQAGL